MATVLPNLIAINMDTVLFAKEETTFATEIKPTTADQILVAGEGSFKQALGFIPDAQLRNSYSEVTDIQGRYEPGEFNFPLYIKPSGALGTKPECAALLKNLFGREVVTASTKVEYFLARTTDAVVSTTVWFRQGHFVYRAIGCLVNEGRFPLRAGNTDDAVGQVALSGMCSNILWTGTDELASATAAVDTTITVKDASKFTAGGYVEIGSQTNAGAGFLINSINYGTNVLTLATAVGAIVAIDSVVKPWMPTGTEVGNPVHGRLGIVTRGGTDMRVVSSEITLTNNWKWLNEEKNGLNYPDRAIRASKRAVTCNPVIYFDANAAKHFREAQQGTKADVLVPVGDTAANRFKLTAKNVRFEAPDVSGGEEKQMTLNGKAFASSALDDELALLFD